MVFLPDRASLDGRPTPQWYADAKLGICVHWGLYSIPAFAQTDADFKTFMADLSTMKDTNGANPYAEWYLNALRIPGSPTAEHHAATYGPNFSYFDFRDQFERNAEAVDFDSWARLFTSFGAQYVVMVTRHLDGYPLWPTKIRHPRMPADYRSRRDIVGDLAAAVRANGLRMGLYYAGGTDLTFTHRPIRRMTDLMAAGALGKEYASYAAAQWHELINRYQPSVLWNDLGWPAEYDPQEIIASYYNSVDDGVVNDRWNQLRLPNSRIARSLYLGFLSNLFRLRARTGKKVAQPEAKVHYDVETHEYDEPTAPLDSAWELTRGLGNSFGYNAEETAADLLTGPQLVHLLVDVVAEGGNLLINVGPDGKGQIPEIQQRPLLDLGGWLRVNGEAILGTRPRHPTSAETADGRTVRFTTKGDTTYAIVLADSLGTSLVVKGLALPVGARPRLLGSDIDLDWSQQGGNVRFTLPGAAAGQPAYVLAISRLLAGPTNSGP